MDQPRRPQDAKLDRRPLRQSSVVIVPMTPNTQADLGGTQSFTLRLPVVSGRHVAGTQTLRFASSDQSVSFEHGTSPGSTLRLGSTSRGHLSSTGKANFLLAGGARALETQRASALASINATAIQVCSTLKAIDWQRLHTLCSWQLPVP